jgi:hypothetical protein
MKAKDRVLAARPPDCADDRCAGSARFFGRGSQPAQVPSVQACQDEELPTVTKDAKDNKRGCIIIAAVVALLVAALAYAILSTGTDPRSNGIEPSGAPPAAPAGAAGSSAHPAQPDI